LLTPYLKEVDQSINFNFVAQCYSEAFPNTLMNFGLIFMI